MRHASSAARPVKPGADPRRGPHSCACQRPMPARLVILPNRQLSWSDVYRSHRSRGRTRGCCRARLRPLPCVPSPAWPRASSARRIRARLVQFCPLNHDWQETTWRSSAAVGAPLSAGEGDGQGVEAGDTVKVPEVGCSDAPSGSYGRRRDEPVVRPDVLAGGGESGPDAGVRAARSRSMKTVVSRGVPTGHPELDRRRRARPPCRRRNRDRAGPHRRAARVPRAMAVRAAWPASRPRCRLDA
jgi:hypothetical protein